MEKEEGILERTVQGKGGKKKPWQTDMVSICLEYVENKADKIYLYASFESNVMASNYFYDIGGTILNKHKLNDANNGFVYDVSFDRQKACLNILMEEWICL